MKKQQPVSPRRRIKRSISGFELVAKLDSNAQSFEIELLNQKTKKKYKEIYNQQFVNKDDELKRLCSGNMNKIFDSIQNQQEISVNEHGQIALPIASEQKDKRKIIYFDTVQYKQSQYDQILSKIDQYDTKLKNMDQKHTFLLQELSQKIKLVQSRLPQIESKICQNNQQNLTKFKYIEKKQNQIVNDFKSKRLRDMDQIMHVQLKSIKTNIEQLRVQLNNVEYLRVRLNSVQQTFNQANLRLANMPPIQNEKINQNQQISVVFPKLLQRSLGILYEHLQLKKNNIIQKTFIQNIQKESDIQIIHPNNNNKFNNNFKTTIQHNKVIVTYNSSTWCGWVGKNPLQQGINKFSATMINSKDKYVMIGITTKSAIGTQKVHTHNQSISYYFFKGFIHAKGVKIAGGRSVNIGEKVDVLVDLKKWKIAWSVNGIELASAIISENMKNKQLFVLLTMCWGGDVVSLQL